MKSGLRINIPRFRLAASFSIFTSRVSFSYMTAFPVTFSLPTIVAAILADSVDALRAKSANLRLTAIMLWAEKLVMTRAESIFFMPQRSLP